MGSFYKQINGKKYSASLLNAADRMAPGGRDTQISKADAKQLLDLIKKDKKYSSLEQETIAYIQENYNFTEASDLFFREELEAWLASFDDLDELDTHAKVIIAEETEPIELQPFVFPAINRNKLFDTRVVERNIKRDLISSTDYQQFIEELEDCSDLADTMETQFMRKVQAEKKQQNQEEKEQ